MEHRIKWCYLCHSTGKLTNDHIPPKNLFPAPLPSNLITVPCCKACNESFSKIDEQFRAYISMPVNVSPIGKEIMRKKVFGNSFEKSPKLKTQVGRNVFQGRMQTPLGPRNIPLVAMDRKAFDPFFIRLTKGLLATFYPDVDYFGLEFKVTQLDQFGSGRAKFIEVTSILTADQRGNGVFRFWHGLPPEQPTTGMWIYQFYDAALFSVRHSNVPWPERLADMV